MKKNTKDNAQKVNNRTHLIAALIIAAAIILVAVVISFARTWMSGGDASGAETLVPTLEDEHISIVDNSGREQNDVQPDEQLTEKQAKDIAANKVPGISIHSVGLDYEDGIRIYEIKGTKGEMVYDIEINASTGIITDYSEKSTAPSAASGGHHSVEHYDDDYDDDRYDYDDDHFDHDDDHVDRDDDHDHDYDD